MATRRGVSRSVSLESASVGKRVFDIVLASAVWEQEGTRLGEYGEELNDP
jgi:hypothetical protein